MAIRHTQNRGVYHYPHARSKLLPAASRARRSPPGVEGRIQMTRWSIVSVMAALLLATLLASPAVAAPPWAMITMRHYSVPLPRSATVGAKTAAT